MKPVKKEVYLPTEAESELALMGGLRYVEGAAFLHDPESTQDFHGYDVDLEPLSLVERAADLIKSGLDKVIRYAHSPEIRSSLAAMEPNYSIAAPNLLDTHTDLYDMESRVQRLFPEIAALMPLPVLEEGIYKRFCHGNFRSPKLPLTQLMEDVSIDERLREYCEPEDLSLYPELKDVA